jgi:hypothetical protein
VEGTLSEEKTRDFEFEAKCDQALADIMAVMDRFSEEQDSYAVLLGAIITICKRQGWGKGQTTFVTATALDRLWPSFDTEAKPVVRRKAGSMIERRCGPASPGMIIGIDGFEEPQD